MTKHYSPLQRRLQRVEIRLGNTSEVAEGVLRRERIDRQNAYQETHPGDELVVRVTGLVHAYLHCLYVERLAAEGRTEGGGPFIAYPDGWRSSEEIAADFDAAQAALDEAVNAWYITTHSRGA